MNPAFIIIILAVAIAAWFLLSWLFPIIGNFLTRVWNNAKYNMNKGDNSRDEG